MPLQSRIDPLVGYAQAWRDPASPWRTEAYPLLPDLSPALIDWGLETTFGAWVGTTGDEASAIRACLAAEFPKPAALNGWVPSFSSGKEERFVPYPVALQILAGNVFAATIHQLMAGLLAGTHQLIKPATAQRPFVELLLRTLSQVDLDLAGTIELIDESNLASAYQRADVITLTGSDTTIETITKAITATDATPTLHAFGHRLSVAFIARWCWEHDTTRAATFEALALDTTAYEQSGCLSPLIAFIEDVLITDLPSLADQAFAALQSCATRWPLATRSASDTVARRAFLDQARMKGQTVLDDGTVAVVLDSSPLPVPSPGHRILVLAPVGHPHGVIEKLAPYRDHLGTLGAALHPAVPYKGWRQSSHLFTKSGPAFNRLCALGQMQTPSIAEPHDGRPRVRLFLRKEER
ncbi:MAG: acyl-CoA reductase [bacterium]